ncbi:MAG: DUF2784 family protein [Nitrospira sp. CR1.3]|nr:DUF2784 family protein [Nitrospira sp. CR1.3]
MLEARLADLIVLLHVAFVLFVLFGGFLSVKWPRAMWLHVPAAVWGAVVEFTGSTCPLTPLENRLREQSGQSLYRSDFIAHYILPILYPDDLTRELQTALGTVVLLLNAALYGWLWHLSHRRP